jgi:hypothetical protein
LIILLCFCAAGFFAACGSPGGSPYSNAAAVRAAQFRDALNAGTPGSVAVDAGTSAYVNVVKNLTLNANVGVPAGVTFIVKSGNTLTVGTGAALDLTAGGLVLENNTTLTVNGTVNAKATAGSASFGIVIMPGPAVSATINGSGIIHLKTQGVLLAIMAGQTLILEGTVTLDGLATGTTYPGTSTPYPSGIGGDAMDNVSHVVFVAGGLDMRGGTITGNYNTVSSQTGTHGGGVEVNKYQGGDGSGVANFTMSGGAITGNGSARAGGGVNVCKGGTFIMEGSAEISLNSAGVEGGGVAVHNDGIFTMKGGAKVSGNTAAYGGGVEVHSNESAVSTFTLEGGTVYGSGAGADTANTATTSGASLYVSSGCTAIWGSGSTGISGGTGGPAGGNIISGGTGGTNDTLTATGGT